MARTFSIEDGPSQLHLLLNQQGDARIQPPISFRINTDVRGVSQELKIQLSMSGTPALYDRQEWIFDGYVNRTDERVRGVFNVQNRSGWLTIYAKDEIRRAEVRTTGAGSKHIWIHDHLQMFGNLYVDMKISDQDNEVVEVQFFERDYKHTLTFNIRTESLSYSLALTSSAGPITAEKQMTNWAARRVVRYIVELFDKGIKNHTLEFPTNFEQDGWEAQSDAMDIIDKLRSAIE